MKNTHHTNTTMNASRKSTRKKSPEAWETPQAQPEAVELFNKADLTKIGAETVKERNLYDSFSLMNIRDGVAYYYTIEKFWHPDYRRAGVFSYLDCGEYRRLFKRSGLGVLVLKSPLSKSLGVELL